MKTYENFVEQTGAGGPNAVSPNSVAKQFLNNLPSKGAMGAKSILQKPKLMPNKNIPGQHV